MIAMKDILANKNILQSKSIKGGKKLKKTFHYSRKYNILKHFIII